MIEGTTLSTNYALKNFNVQEKATTSGGDAADKSRG